jgi:UDPglucose 6-dehydrogenase
MRVTVVGTGYVGLVAGACFADSGNQVFCLDVDPGKIERLKRAEIPIYEPGLDLIVARNLQTKRIRFTTDYAQAIQGAEVIFLAVGTPPLPSGEPDLSFLRSAVHSIGKNLSASAVLVNKSTVPVGTHRLVAEWLKEVTDLQCPVVSNPEFLKEGTAVEDFLKPDRVIIGTTDDEAYRKMAELYSSFVRQGNPILRMDPVSAELAKYASNAFLAARISFMNELAILCERVGGDVEEVRRGMSADVRIGRHFLYAGAGYGGSCFPKDVSALLSTARKMNLPLDVVSAAESANARQKGLLARKVRARFGENLAGLTFAVWGVSFKPNTDDIREAPALTIIDELTRSGARVRAYDPVAMENASRHFQGNDSVEFIGEAYRALEQADALLLVTEWNEFRNPDFGLIRESLKQPVVFDGRNIWNPKQMRDLGFEYSAVGRGR